MPILSALLAMCLSTALPAQPAEPEDVLSPVCALSEADAYRLTEDYAAARARYQRVLPYYEEQGDAYRIAYINLWLSETSYYLPNADSGMAEVQRALRIAETEMNPDTLSFYCTILQNVGIFHSQQGDFEQQMAFYRRAHRAAITTHSRYSVESADAYLSLGAAFGRRGNWPAAIAYTDTSLQIAKAIKYQAGQSSALLNLSYAYAERGAFARAISFQKQALKLCASEVERARGYNNLGTLYIDIGDLNQAMHFLQRALDLRRRLYPDDASTVFSTVLNIVHVQSEQGETMEAKARLDELVESLLAMSGPSSAMLQIAYNYQAKLSLLLDDPAGARRWCQRAEAVGCRYRTIRASTQLTKGEVWLVSKLYQGALRAVQQGFQFLLEDFEPEGPAENPGWRSLKGTGLGRKLLVLKGNILREWGRSGEQPELLQQSLACFRLADSLVTASRLSYTNRASKALLSANARSLYESMVETLYALYEQSKSPGIAAQAFYYMEKSKALSVLENLNELYARSFHDIPDELVQKEQKLRKDIEFYNNLIRQQPQSEQLSRWERALYSLQEQQDELLTEIAQNHPQYYEMRLSLRTASLESVRKRLLYPGETLVEYFVGEDQVYVLMANAEKAWFFRLPGHQLAAQCVDLREKIMKQERVEAISHRLYQRIFEPLEDALPGEQLLIIPDGHIAYVPFDQLIRHPSQSGGLPHYLVQDYSIRHLLSASTALQARRFKAASSQGDILAFAPEFSAEASFNRSTQQLSKLPGAQLELDSLEQLFAGTFLRAEAASEYAFKRRRSHRGALHIATHTEIDDRFPAASKLLLPGGGREGEDGNLFAYELYSLSLGAELVFLSACNTGYGLIEPGEGSVSLAHAFAYAGCPNLVMTLWPVRDRTTPLMVSTYYRNLAQGMDKAEALRQAKLFYLVNDRLFAHPYFWSGFTYIGDREELSLRPAPDRAARQAFWWSAAAFLLVLALTARLLTRP